MEDYSTLLTELRSLPATVDEVDYARRGYHLDVTLTADKVRDLAELLRRHQFYLVFVSAVDLAPDAECIYQFARYGSLCRIMARAYVLRDGTMPTISDIFHGANWHERETKDMYGIVFSGHPYLQPLLLPEEDADLKPLRKNEKSIKIPGAVRWLPEAPAPAATAAPKAGGDTPTTPEQG
jgi:NADH-quinone oxidoreductase subunit C